MIPYVVQHFFAGLWPLIWHWGIPAAIIILCVAGEVALTVFAAYLPFTAPVTSELQKWLLAVAVAAGAFLFALSDGIKIEHARCVAQQAVVTRQVNDVVTDVLKEP